MASTSDSTPNMKNQLLLVLLPRLVGGDWNHGILNDFPFSWEWNNHPNWLSLIFSRGVGWNHQPVEAGPVNKLFAKFEVGTAGHLLQSEATAPDPPFLWSGLFAYICIQEFKEFHGWICPMNHEIFMSMSWNSIKSDSHVCNILYPCIQTYTAWNLYNLIKERVVSPGRSYMLMRGGRRKWAFLSLDGIGRSGPTAPSQGMGKSWWSFARHDFSGIFYRGRIEFLSKKKTVCCRSN